MRKDAQASRAALLEAAWARFSQEGPDVALTSVAEAAGVGIATLYRHFPRREDLVVGLVGEMLTRVRRLAEAHLERWEADPEAAWESWVRELAALQVSALVIPLAAREALASLPPEVKEQRRQTLGRVEELLDAGRAAGLVREGVDAERFVVSLAAVTRPLPQPAARKLPDEHEWLVEMFLRGLRPDPA